MVFFSQVVNCFLPILLSVHLQYLSFTSDFFAVVFYPTNVFIPFLPIGLYPWFLLGLWPLQAPRKLFSLVLHIPTASL